MHRRYTTVYTLSKKPCGIHTLTKDSTGEEQSTDHLKYMSPFTKTFYIQDCISQGMHHVSERYL